MATREENIKKINDELEQLSDEELDKVAGGSMFTDFKMPNKNPNTDTDSNPLSNPKAALRFSQQNAADGRTRQQNPFGAHWSLGFF